MQRNKNQTAYLPYLEPFEDVNKRVSRLAANIPFIRHNLCPLSFIDVPKQAYECSCQQYVAVQQNLATPDIFRLPHRKALGEVVAAIVRSGEAATTASVRARIPALVPEVDREYFVALTLAEFTALHAGNAVRFGIRPLEFAAWQEGLVSR